MKTPGPMIYSNWKSDESYWWYRSL